MVKIFTTSNVYGFIVKYFHLNITSLAIYLEFSPNSQSTIVRASSRVY